jgi:glyoxylase-like metal-dependent hydrolase (beta-lactamase superfamily II)
MTMPTRIRAALLAAAANALAAVALGARGALLVDTGFPVFVPQYRAAVAALGGGDIVYAINTHWHDDHSEGNKPLGADRVLLIAHSNSRAMLTHDNQVNVVRTILDQPAYAAAALPAVTFEERMELYFGDERIELLHVARAHTAGDAAVIFRRSNVVHMGDVFLSAAYPFFDVDNGGDFDGLIEFCERVLATIDRDTIIVPGHGPVATYADLASYIEMLRTVRDRVATLVGSGATLAQVVAAQPTREWNGKYGNPTTFFLDRAYKSLKQ